MASIIGVSTGSPAYGFRPRGTLISLSLRVFFPLSLSYTHIFRSAFLFFFFFVRIIEQRTTLLTGKKRHEAACNERGWEVDAAAQVAGGTGLDYQRHGVVPGGTTRLLLRPSCSSFEKFETRFSSPLSPLSTSVRIRVPRSSSVEFRAKC